MKSAVLLSKDRFIEAMRCAEAKDRSISYRRLKADRSISLLYNPATRDGKFSTKLAAREVTILVLIINYGYPLQKLTELVDRVFSICGEQAMENSYRLIYR